MVGSSWGPGPLGNLLEVQNCGPHLDLLSDILGVEPAICVLISPPGDADAYSSLRTIAMENLIIKVTKNESAVHYHDCQQF